MITSTREKDFEAKAELGDTNTNNSKLTKAPSSSRQWSAFRNPRIVRVSRAFGGKDRHSKVCTVRGLRDRRIRLSVPTAIQLYDLQERLGLSQPSKVVDWLMDATKNDIDKLPPLQMPPGNFSQFYPPTLNSHDLNSPQSSLSPFFNPNPTYMKGGITINNNVGDDELPIMARSKGWEFGGKLKEVVERENSGIMDKTKWNSARTHEQENQDGSGGGNYIPQVSAAQNLFPMASNSNSFPSFLNNNSMPYNYFQWDPNSNLSLSQFPSQTESANAGNLMSIQSSMAFPSGSQLFLSPPLATPSMIFPPLPPYVATLGDQSDHTRQINHFPFLSSNSHHILSNPIMSSLHSFSSPLSTSTSKVDIHSPNDERQPNKGITRGS